MTVPGDAVLKEPSKFRIIGKPTRRVDTPDIVTGKAIYAQDVKVPNALYGVVARRPAFGADLRSVDDSAARKVPGVVDVVRISSGVAVLADNTWAAMKGREALVLDWNLGPNAALDTAELTKRTREAVGEHPEMPAGATVVDATYDFPFLSHYTMEPMNAVADVRADGCTIWVPSQGPDSVQQMASRMLGMPASSVVVHTTLLGGGFGRRSQTDFVQDAVEASRAAKRPVKLLWTRDDDLKNDHYRQMSYHVMRGAVSGGKPVAFNHQFIGVGGGSTRSASRPSPTRNVYNIPNSTMMQGSAASPVPTGAWRSVNNSQVNPAIEMFIDELAHAAGKDPLQFRRENTDDKRMLAVLDLIEEKSGWKKPLPQGVARGIAVYDGYDGRVAHVVELSIVDGAVKVHRAVCCIDTGPTINPMAVEMQLQGAFIDGLSTALHAAVTIDKGGVVQSTPYDYEWTRLAEAPKTEVYIIQSGDGPCGMGEIGYPSAPAAVANAVAAATGKRVRKFPIKLDELV
jgi:isoquinoline 1-oxidoreductase beta subunit